MSASLSKSFHEYGRNDRIAGTMLTFSRTSKRDVGDLATRREHEALIRQQRQERIAKEQEKKVSEWRMAIEREAAQRRQAEIERERRIREMKEREAQRRRQFEERRKALQDQEAERRRKIMAKYTSSTNSINSSNCGSVNQKVPNVNGTPQKRQTATAPIYAFGSSTPRTLGYLEKLKSDMKAYGARLKSAPSTLGSTTKNVDKSPRTTSSLSHFTRQSTSTKSGAPQRTISAANLNGKNSVTTTPGGRMASSMYVPKTLNSPSTTVQPVIKKPPSRSSQTSVKNKEHVRPKTNIANNTDNRMTRSFAAASPTDVKHMTALLSLDRRQETPRSVKRKPVEKIAKVEQKEECDDKSLNYSHVVSPRSRFSPSIRQEFQENETPNVAISVLLHESDYLQASNVDADENSCIEKAEEHRQLQEELERKRKEEEMECKRKEQEELAAVEALRLVEEKRFKTIMEEELARKEAEEKSREEAKRKQIEAEARLREQQERLERERKEVEERARREEEERLERKKKLDAIMQRTRNSAVKSTPLSSSVNSAATTLLQPPDALLPTTTFSTSSSPSATSENTTSTSSYAPMSPSTVTPSYTNNNPSAQSQRQIHSSSSAALLQKYANSNSEIGRSVENILAKVRSNSALNRNLANGNHSINSQSAAGGDSNANLSLQSNNLSKTNLLATRINEDAYDSFKRVNSVNDIEAGGDQSNDSKSQYDIDAKSDASRSYFALLLQNRNSNSGGGY